MNPLRAIKIAVVGSGPAGFYTTQRLIKNPNVNVHIYERLPIPFGLVRYGVAPDHTDVKNVIKSFTKIANNNQVKFLGNVNVGSDVTLDDLSNAYHAVVLAYGSSIDKMLEIKGETTRNTISARNFVGWYNGIPEDKNLDVNLNCHTACIVGHGNVALDCARILCNPARLTKTDITSISLDKLNCSRVKRVFVIGRRGPIQASFTPKELQQLIELMPSRIKLDPENLFEMYNVVQENLPSLDRRRYRVTKLFFDSLQRQLNKQKLVDKDSVECIFKFMAAPHSIEPNKDGSVARLILNKTKFNSHSSFMDVNAKPQLTDALESLDCGLIIKSIGFKSNLIDPRLPYNHQLGAISNTNGKIHGYNNMYCSGWLATGAHGVIAGTLASSEVTAKSIISDIEEGRIKPGSPKVGDAILRGLKVVEFKDWEKIDKLEILLGQKVGKTREKFVSVEDILRIVSNIGQ